MDPFRLRELQKAQTGVLVDFHKFCMEHDLTYFLAYGTLLGAVRHKGFIPWDDDVDTFMTRREYEKFMEIQALLPSDIHVWEVCYSDIRHAGLCRLVRKFDDTTNAQIDIFILDYGKNRFGKLCKLLHLAKLSKNEKLILIRHFKGQPLKQLIVNLSRILRILCLGSANLEKLIYKLKVNKESATYITLEGSETFSVKNFQDKDLLDFEGHKLFAPSQWKEILTEMYGNYMEIPPEGVKWMKENGNSNI